MTNTTNLNQQDPVEGGSYDTWGDILDANRQIVDKAAGSTATIATTGGTHTLTQDESNHAILKITGTLASNAIIDTLAGKSRFWQVINATSGAYTVTIRVAGGAGASVVVTQGKWALVNTDGADCRVIDLSTLQGILPAGTVVTASIGDGQVTTVKVADGAVTTPKLDDAAVTTPKVADNNITLPKLQQVAPRKILGNITNAPANVVELPIYDEDDMASNSDQGPPTQQSAKAYIDGRLADKFTISTSTPSGGQDGDIWFRVLP